MASRRQSFTAPNVLEWPDSVYTPGYRTETGSRDADIARIDELFAETSSPASENPSTTLIRIPLPPKFRDRQLNLRATSPNRPVPLSINHGSKLEGVSLNVWYA